MPGLSPAKRRELKARAHAIDPVVLVGSDGLSAAILADIDRALKSHELIKVRVRAADREVREAFLGDICRATGAEPVQHIGRILVVFRENPETLAPASPPQQRRRAKRRP